MSTDACYRDGECGNQLTSVQGMGVGVKHEVNVLEANNQHVEIFTEWPSSLELVGVTEQCRLLSVRAVQKHGTILLDEPCC